MRSWLPLVALLVVGGCDALFGLDRLRDGTVGDAPRPDDDANVTSDGPKDPRLLAHFSFDGDFVDRVNGQIATCVSSDPTCPTFAPGRIGDAAAFDGVSQCLQFSLPGSPMHVTVAAWIYRADDLGRTAVAKLFGATSFDSWQVDTESNSQLRFITYDGSVEKIMTLTNVLTQNTWQHVAVTYDGTNKLMFLNGNPLPVVATGEQVITDGSPMMIGCDRNSGQIARLFKGRIDELRIYNEALSTTEVAMLAAP